MCPSVPYDSFLANPKRGPFQSATHIASSNTCGCERRTRLLLPSGLQLPVCDAPEMPTARPERASALAALGYASDSGVCRVLSTGSSKYAAAMRSLPALKYTPGSGACRRLLEGAVSRGCALVACTQACH